MGSIILNGITYGGMSGPAQGDHVTITPVFDSGAKIADVIINDEDMSIYVPSGGSVNGVLVDGQNVVDEYNIARIDLSSKQNNLIAGTHITLEGSLIDAQFDPFTGISEGQNGTAGLVPAPTAADTSKFLKSDGTWAIPPSAQGTIVIPNIQGEIIDHLHTLSIDDAIYDIPSGSEITITPSTVNTGATIADITIDESTYTLRAPAETVQAITFNNSPVTITSGTASILSPIMTGASSSTDGESGLVPTPTTASVDKFLRGDGAWATPPGGGSSVEITPILSTGTKIAEYEIDGVSGDLYAPSGGGTGSTVSITPSLSTGTKIADFEIDGSSGSLFAPAGGGGTTAYGGTTPPAASLGNNGDFYYQYDSIEDEMTMTFYVKLNNAWRKILTPSGGDLYYTDYGRTTMVGESNMGMEGVKNAD